MNWSKTLTTIKNNWLLASMILFFVQGLAVSAYSQSPNLVPYRLTVRDSTINSEKQWQLITEYPKGARTSGRLVSDPGEFTDSVRLISEIINPYNNMLKQFAASIAASARQSNMTRYRTQTGNAYNTHTGRDLQTDLDSMWLDQYVGPWEVLFDTAQIKNVSWSEVATGGGTFTNGYARFRMYVDATGLGRVVNNWNDVIRTDTTIAPVYLAVGSGRYRLSVSALTENGAPGTQSMIRVGLRHRPGVGSYSLVRTFPFVAYVEPVIKQGAFTEDYIFGDQDYAIKMTRINR